MDKLRTKNGVPLRVRGDRIYNADSDNFGYIRDDRVFGLDGAYRGTIVGDRLIYRSTHSARQGGARGSTGSIGGSGAAHRAGSGMWGDEPNTEP